MFVRDKKGRHWPLGRLRLYIHQKGDETTLARFEGDDNEEEMREFWTEAFDDALSQWVRHVFPAPPGTVALMPNAEMMVNMGLPPTCIREEPVTAFAHCADGTVQPMGGIRLMPDHLAIKHPDGRIQSHTFITAKTMDELLAELRAYIAEFGDSGEKAVEPAE